jgi:hypothetical protein
MGRQFRAGVQNENIEVDRTHRDLVSECVFLGSPAFPEQSFDPVTVYGLPELFGPHPYAGLEHGNYGLRIPDSGYRMDSVHKEQRGDGNSFALFEKQVDALSAFQSLVLAVC